MFIQEGMVKGESFYFFIELINHSSNNSCGRRVSSKVICFREKVAFRRFRRNTKLFHELWICRRLKKFLLRSYATACHNFGNLIHVSSLRDSENIKIGLTINKCIKNLEHGRSSLNSEVAGP